MKTSASTFLSIRGLRYHVRTWGNPDAPRLFFLHGWMDVSASFQFAVDALKHDWFVIAPDWRGFGLSEWNNDSYWFPDYIADLDALLRHFQPDAPAILVGHSMGGNVANLYAGIRRTRRKAGAGGRIWTAAHQPGKAPERYAQWLDENRQAPTLRPTRRSRKSFSGSRPTIRVSPTNAPRSSLRTGPSRCPAAASDCAPTPAQDGESGALPRGRGDGLLAAHHRAGALAVGRREWMMKWMKGDKALLDSYRACYRSLHEETIAHAGHMMHHDQPERFAHAVESFLLA
jgi:pimeloyl-ACP methyl ester carboxylesterase